MKIVKKPKGYRKIHIQKDIWFYKIGKDFVRIVKPNKKSEVIHIESFDFDWTISRDSGEMIGWEGTTIDDVPHYNLQEPSKIKEYIEKNLLTNKKI